MAPSLNDIMNLRKQRSNSHVMDTPSAPRNIDSLSSYRSRSVSSNTSLNDLMFDTMPTQQSPPAHSLDRLMSMATVSNIKKKLSLPTSIGPGRKGSINSDLLSVVSTESANKSPSIISDTSNYLSVPNSGEHLKKEEQLLINVLATGGFTSQITKMNHVKGSSHLPIELFMCRSQNNVYLPYVDPKKFRGSAIENLLQESGDEDYEDRYDNCNSESSRSGTPKPADALETDRLNHSIVVIIKLKKSALLTPKVRIRYQTLVTAFWPLGYIDHEDKLIHHECYKVAKDVDWDLSLDEANHFIPFKEDSEYSVSDSSGSGDDDGTGVFSIPYNNVKTLELLKVSQYQDYDEDKLKMIPDDETRKGGYVYKPGYYCFTLSVMIPNVAPESTNLIYSKLQHQVVAQLQKNLVSNIPEPELSYSMSPRSSELSRFNFLRRKSESVELEPETFKADIPVVRLPPPMGTTTFNKSIYVNKVWGNALNYEVLLPQKYVRLTNSNENATMNLQLKLVPLIKDIQLKRIKINVLERVKYVSKDMTHEYRYGDIPNSKTKSQKERKITLFEIRTRDKSKHESLRTEVIKNCQDDNLLTACFNNGDVKSRKMRQKTDEIVITNPVKVSCPLTFKAAFPGKEQTYGLNPDFTTFTSVVVKHRLQICFRISVPEEGNSEKFHHYEVIIDTPLILISPDCKDDILTLPDYSENPRSGFSLTSTQKDQEDSDNLPTFEEAVLQPSSPLMQPSSSTDMAALQRRLSATDSMMSFSGLDNEFNAIDDVLNNADALSGSIPNEVFFNKDIQFGANLSQFHEDTVGPRDKPPSYQDAIDQK
ncbi:hypothetical protein LJB42_000531 [Komagataella kurtzmanii]|nr:hypothetical protein LJB42_000531 [Komagataella kurtzmanii]